LPVAERAARRILSLPMSPHLSDAQVARVAEVIRGTLGSGEARLAEEVVA
jgi:dTDP-4-amino-4,6-dideoxygalactose transaminase